MADLASIPDVCLDAGVLLAMDIRDLARAQAVCRTWLQAAQHARRAAFRKRWGFSAVLNEPRSTSVFELLSVSQLAFKHAVGAEDTLPQVAFRYGVDATAIKRFNNLISEGLLQHRHEVFIPVTSASQAGGCTVLFEYSTLLRREVAVLVSPPASADVDAAQRSQAVAPSLGLGTGDGSFFNRTKVRQLRAEVRQMLHQASALAVAASLPPPCGGAGQQDGQPAPPLVRVLTAPSLWNTSLVDLSSAKYYLHDAKGDVTAAARAIAADVVWENVQDSTALPCALCPSPPHGSAAASRLAHHHALPWYAVLCGGLCGQRRQRHSSVPQWDHAAAATAATAAGTCSKGGGGAPSGFAERFGSSGSDGEEARGGDAEDEGGDAEQRPLLASVPEREVVAAPGRKVATAGGGCSAGCHSHVAQQLRAGTAVLINVE